MMHLTEAQQRELRWAMHNAEKGYIRVKATAIWNLGQGGSQRTVARLLDVSPTSVFSWQKRYLAEGLAGLKIRPGRGRRSRVDLEEVEHVLHRTPRSMGIPLTRWTLESLSRAVPSLQGLSPSGVWRVLERGRLSYKRGQPRVMSPDPGYVEKRALAGSASGSGSPTGGSGLAL